MDQISLWFVCKSCRSSFPGVTNFIKHKTQNHFNEFKSVTCIVFEESFAEAEGEIITKPEEEGFVEDHVDKDCCSKRSQSPNLTLNNNNSTFTNSDCEILEQNKLFTNPEQDSVDSRAVSFTIENDSVTINVGPLNDVDSAFAPNPNRTPQIENGATKNQICDVELMQSPKVTVQKMLDSLNSEERTLLSPDIQENSDSELTVFLPESVDLALDSSQDVEINSVVSSFDVCTDAAADVDLVNPGADPDHLQCKSDQAGKTVEIETTLATVEQSEYRICVAEENKDFPHSLSYDTSVEAVDKKYGFWENPFVLLRRLTAKELQSAATVLKPIQEHSRFIDDKGSDIDYVSINSDTTKETSSDSEPDDTYYPQRQKINSNKNLVSSESPKNRFLNTSLTTTAKRKLPISLHCDLCNKSFKRSNMILHNFRNHLPMEEKIAQARFKCDECPKVFLRKGALRSHAVSHKSKTERHRPFVCEICGHSCTTKSELEKHLKSHSDSRPFKCQFPNCVSAFKLKNNLKFHLNVFHSNSRPFKCSHPNCTKAFKDRETLKAHTMGVHSGKRRYPVQLLPCTQENCDKKYETAQGLKSHLITVHCVGSETDLQSFLCELCGKVFKIKQHLQSHTLLVHTQDCPFKCTVEGCSAAFKLKSRLVEHERVHSGQKKYLCTVCGKSYSIYISFNHHQLSHKKDSSSSLKVTA